MPFLLLFLHHWDNKELWWTCGCNCKWVIASDLLEEITGVTYNTQTETGLAHRLGTAWTCIAVDLFFFDFDLLSEKNWLLHSYETSLKNTVLITWSNSYRALSRLLIPWSCAQFCTVECCTRKKIPSTLRRRNLEKYSIHRLFWNYQGFVAARSKIWP